MPVTYGTYEKQLKLLPLTLHASGGASVVVRFGYVGEDGEFSPTTEQTFAIDAENVEKILGAQPTPGLSRRDDLSFAIYTHLVTHGLVAAGSIS
jgi:hypothetical protein